MRCSIRWWSSSSNHQVVRIRLLIDSCEFCVGRVFLGVLRCFERGFRCFEGFLGVFRCLGEFLVVWVAWGHFWLFWVVLSHFQVILGHFRVTFGKKSLILRQNSQLSSFELASRWSHDEKRIRTASRALLTLTVKTIPDTD